MKPIFKPQTEWLPPESFPDLSKYDEIAIDLETKDPELKTMGSGSVTNRGHIVGIAVAVHDWVGYYPIRHEGGGNMDHGMVTRWFQGVLNTPAIKIFHNAMYDVCFLRAERYKIEGQIVDTMIAGSLVDENRFRYDLGSLGRDYVGIGKNEAVLKETADHWGIDHKAEMYKLPAMYVGEYAEQDATLTYKLWQEMKKEILSQDLEDIFNLETELFPCLVDMRFLGVRVDMDAAHKLKEELVAEEKQCLQQVYKETGIDVQIWAARSIAEVFKKRNLPFERTAKTGAPSFTKNFLQNQTDPVVKAIAHAREINKSHTTFIDTILKHSHNGRIHAEINQIRSDQGGTVTGRFSYNNPNLQQIPARNKELGPRIRSLFINKLQAELGVSKEHAEDLFRTYHDKVPFVKMLMESVMRRAQDRGRVRTLLGRRCRFNLWEPNQFGIHKALPHEEALAEHGPGIKRAYTYKALNKLIQGSAADMTKKAMVDLYKEGIIPHIQVHDELDISVDGNADKIKEIMESAVELEVPNKVDYESGPNWGTIK
jgi:DNA polymerase I-like protein with 3'-5' exonuclease and polymerase domains